MAELPAEVSTYYATVAEESRLTTGASRLELERTKEILSRVLPPAPARIVDVGGAAGAYSLWLARRGYYVHLVDASARLVEEARRRNERAAKRIASLTVADARSLPQESMSAAAVLVMGPLYHLTEARDRAAALVEAFRVAAPGGPVPVAAISRSASTLDRLARNRTRVPTSLPMRTCWASAARKSTERRHDEAWRRRVLVRPARRHGLGPRVEIDPLEPVHVQVAEE